jgi:hypothetical protein
MGDSPVSAPTVFEAIQKDKVTLAKHLLTIEEITKKYSAKEVGDFLYAVEQHITSHKKSDGSFKTTPNTENCQLPNFLEAEQMSEIGRGIEVARTKLSSSKKEAEAQEVLDELTALSKKIEKLAFKISGCDIKKLTDWEKELVAIQVYTSAADATLSAVGKQLGN